MRLGTSLHSLTRRSDFTTIYKKGTHAVTKGLILQTLPFSDTSDNFRIGFTVSRKIGNAVERNRTKRRLRALIQQYLPAHAIPAHYVFIARKHTKERAFNDLRADLIYALNALGCHK